MTAYTDKKLNHNRPDITLVRKDTQKWTLIDIAVPADQNISTEEEKVDRYQDLTFEIKRIHRASKVTVIPIVIGALGTISRNAIESQHGKLDIPDSVGSTQLSAILGTAHVVRKVLCLSVSCGK